MKSALIPPFIQKDLEDHFCQWKKVIDLKEIGSVIFFPKSDRLWRLPYFLNWCQQTKLPPIKIINPLASPIENIEDIIEKSKETNLIVNFAESLLLPDRQGLFSELYQWQREKNIGMLLLFEAFPHKLEAHSFLQYYSDFLQHFLFYPLYNRENVFQFCRYLAQKWQFKIEEKTIGEIFQFSGGHTWLVKEIVRQMKVNACSFAESLKAETLVWKMNNLWQSFDEKIKDVLIKIVLGKKPVNLTVEKELLCFNLINNELDGNLPQFVKELVQHEFKSEFKFKNDRLIFRKEDISHEFSKKELKLLKFLISEEGNILSKEKVADKYWGDDLEKSYSEWALDQVFYRLRQKLKELGVSYMIKTCKNKGYEWKRI